MKRIFTLILSLVLCTALLCPMMPVFAAEGDDPTEDGTITLRVGTFNIHNGGDVAHDYDKLGEDILMYHLDVVGLQEIDYKTSRNGGRDTMAELSEYTEFPYYCYNKAINLGTGQYGTAILSRYPIESYETIDLPGDGEHRVLGHAVIDVNGTKIDFYNTHLAWPEKADRTKQLAFIGNIYAQKELAILTGDLNTETPKEYAPSFPLSNFANGLNEKFITNEEDGAIDNIISTANRVVQTDAVAVETGHSDHKLLYADLTILPDSRFVETDDGIRYLPEGEPVTGEVTVGYDTLCFNENGYLITEGEDLESFTALGKTFYRKVVVEEDNRPFIVTTAAGEDVTDKMTDGNLTGYLDGVSHWYYQPSGPVWTLQGSTLVIGGIGELEDEGFARFNDQIETIVVAPKDTTINTGENNFSLAYLTAIKSGAFAGLTNVKKAYIPEGIALAEDAFDEGTDVELFRTADKALTVAPVGYGIVNENGKTLLKLTVKDGDSDLALTEGQKVVVLYTDGEKNNEGKFFCSLIKFSALQPTFEDGLVVFDMCALEGEDQFIPHIEMTYIVNLYVLNADGSIAAAGSTKQFAVQCRVEPIVEERVSQYSQYSDENYLDIDLRSEKTVKTFGAAYISDSRYYTWQLYGTNDPTLPLFAWDLLGVKEDKTKSNQGMYTIDVNAGPYRYLRLCTEYASSRWTALYTEIAVECDEQTEEVIYGDNGWAMTETEHWRYEGEEHLELPGSRAEHVPGDPTVEIAATPDEPGLLVIRCAVCDAILAKELIPYEAPDYPVITLPDGEDVTDQMTDGDLTNYINNKTFWYYELQAPYWTVEQGVLEIAGVGELTDLGFARFNDRIHTIIIAPQSVNPDIRYGSDDGPFTGFTMTKILPGAFKGLTNVKKAYIPEGIELAEDAFDEGVEVTVYRTAAKTLTVAPADGGFVNEDGKTLLKLTVKDGENDLVLEEGQKIVVFYTDGEKKNEGNFYCTALKYSELQPEFVNGQVVFDICSPTDENQFIPHYEMTYIVNLYVLNADGSVAALGSSDQFAVKCTIEPIFGERTSAYIQYSPNNYLNIDLGEAKSLKSFGAAFVQDSRYYTWQVYGTNDPTLPLFAWDLLGAKLDKTPSNEGMYTVDIEGEYRYLRICCEYASSRWTALFTEIAVVFEEETELTYDEDLWFSDSDGHFHIYNENGQEVPGTREAHTEYLLNDIIEGKKKIICAVCGALISETDITYPIVLNAAGEDVTALMTDGDLSDYLDGDAHWYFWPEAPVWTIQNGVLIIGGVGELDNEGFARFNDEIHTIVVAPQNPEIKYGGDFGVTTGVILSTIRSGAFAGLTNVKKAYIPDNVDLANDAFDEGVDVTVFRTAAKTLTVAPAVDYGIVNEDGKTLLKLTVKDGDNDLVLGEDQKVVVVYTDGEKNNEAGLFFCAALKYSELQPTYADGVYTFDICAPVGEDQFIPQYRGTYIVNFYVLNADGSIAALGSSEQFAVRCVAEPIVEERTSRYVQHSCDNFLIIDLGKETPIDSFSAGFCQANRFYRWQVYGSNDPSLPLCKWDLLGAKDSDEISEGMFTVWTNGESYRFLCICCAYNSSNWGVHFAEIAVNDGVKTVDEDRWLEDENGHYRVYKETGEEVPGTREAHTAGAWIIDEEPGKDVCGSKHTECTVCGRVLETGTIPPTGDNTALFAAIAFAAITLLGCAVASCVKESKKRVR